MIEKIICFTGLSGVWKTTLAKYLKKVILNKSKIKKREITIIDGDKFRKKTNKKNLFTKRNIFQNNIEIIKHISKIKFNKKIILVSVISPLKSTRKLARQKFSKKYFEVFVHCKLKTLEQRDTKGLYAKARMGKITNLVGVNSRIRYEKSTYKKLMINTDALTKRQSVNKILNSIFKKKLLSKL